MRISKSLSIKRTNKRCGVVVKICSLLVLPWGSGERERFLWSDEIAGSLPRFVFLLYCSPLTRDWRGWKADRSGAGRERALARVVAVSGLAWCFGRRRSGGRARPCAWRYPRRETRRHERRRSRPSGNLVRVSRHKKTIWGVLPDNAWIALNFLNSRMQSSNIT